MSPDSSLKPTAPFESSLLTGTDIHFFKEGTHSHLYRKLGCHLMERDGESGAQFAVWAPNAVEVSVLTESNAWRPGVDALRSRPDESGIWEGFVAGVAHGHAYKYRIVPRHGAAMDKADPFAVYAEAPPAQASRAWNLGYGWNDDEWMKTRAAKNALDAAFAADALPRYAADAIHLNDAGHAALAAHLERALLEAGVIAEPGVAHSAFDAGAAGMP